MSERLITALALLAMIGFLAWLGWRPGGPMNPHDWMTSHFKPYTPVVKEPLPAAKPGEAVWGINGQEIDMNVSPVWYVPFQFELSPESTKDGKRVSASFDICLKHGEFRRLW